MKKVFCVVACVPFLLGAYKNKSYDTNKIPEFTGEIGNYEASNAFTKFIFDNQMKPVFINAYYFPDESDVIENDDDTFGANYFHLWNSCPEQLEPNEKPSSLKCRGTGFSINRGDSPKDANFTYIRSTLRVQGYFVIQGCSGLHQGSMGCTMRPLNPEDILCKFLSFQVPNSHKI
jgi:hypothetical protein